MGDENASRKSLTPKDPNQPDPGLDKLFQQTELQDTSLLLTYASGVDGRTTEGGSIARTLSYTGRSGP
jgi:hypothetical protein